MSPNQPVYHSLCKQTSTCWRRTSQNLWAAKFVTQIWSQTAKEKASIHPLTSHFQVLIDKNVALIDKEVEVSSYGENWSPNKRWKIMVNRLFFMFLLDFSLPGDLLRRPGGRWRSRWTLFGCHVMSVVSSLVCMNHMCHVCAGGSAIIPDHLPCLWTACCVLWRLISLWDYTDLPSPGAPLGLIAEYLSEPVTEMSLQGSMFPGCHSARPGECCCLRNGSRDCLQISVDSSMN